MWYLIYIDENYGHKFPKKMLNKKSIAFFSLVTLLGSVSIAKAQTSYILQTIDEPSALPNHTFVTGISGARVIGIYADNTNQTNGFYYNGSTWIKLDLIPTGISTSTVIGEKFDSNGVAEGVVYRNGVITIFKAPLVGGGTVGDPILGGTQLNGISGTHMVGTYTDINRKLQGFLYNGVNALKLINPMTVIGGIVIGATVPTSIDKTHIVGYTHSAFGGTTGIHGFLYDGKNWAVLDCPFGGNTIPTGLSGSNVVGTYTDGDTITRGFLYNTNSLNWTTIDDLLGDDSVGTYPTGVDGNTIVGTYTDTNNQVHSFKLVPEMIVSTPPPPLFQSIAIDTNSLPAMTYYGVPQSKIIATADSGLPVTFTSSNHKVVTISGTNTINIVGVGATIITATQSGGNGYLAATPVKIPITVFKGTQTITFTPQTTVSFIPNQKIALSASSTSGLSVTFTSNKASVISVIGKTATIKGKGTVTITAHQAGNANWSSALPVPVVITVQ